MASSRRDVFLRWLYNELLTTEIDSDTYLNYIVEILDENLPDLGPSCVGNTFEKQQHETTVTEIYQLLRSCSNAGNQLSHQLAKEIVRYWLKSIKGEIIPLPEPVKEDPPAEKAAQIQEPDAWEECADAGQQYYVSEDWESRVGENQEESDFYEQNCWVEGFVAALVDEPEEQLEYEYDEDAEFEDISTKNGQMSVLQSLFPHYTLEFLETVYQKMDQNIERSVALILVNEDMNNYGFEVLKAFSNHVEPPDTTKVPVCRYFLQGRCYRSDCWYSHEIEKATCKYWIQGTCIKGDYCEFSHGFDVEGSLKKIKSNTDRNLHPENPTFSFPVDFPTLQGMKYQSVPQNAEHLVIPTDMQLSSKLKLIELKNMFSGANPSEIEKVFKQCGFSFDATVQVLSQEYSITQPLQPLPEPSHVRHTSGRMRAAGSSAEEENWITSDTDVGKLYKAMREEAGEHAVMRNKYFQLATSAYLSRNGEAARYYSRKGRYHDEMMRMIHSRASYAIFIKRNSGKNLSSNTIDLHGLHVNEALDILESYIQSSHHRTLYIFAGSGHHSAKKAKLLPA
eukprot:Sdes_comp19960_c0_seq1m12499